MVIKFEYRRVEEEVPPPPDLITQYEAHRRYGIPRPRLSEAVGYHIPGYIVAERPAARHGTQGAMVSEADVRAFFLKPVFAGEETS